MVVFGTSRGAKSWKKGLTIEKNQSLHKCLSNQEGSASNFGRDDGMDGDVTEVISMKAETTGVVFSNHANALSALSNGNDVSLVNLNRGIEEVRDPQPSHMPMQNFLKNMMK